MCKIRSFLVIFLMLISCKLFAQQYKAFNINNSTVYRWCTWKTTTYEKNGLKQTEKTVNENGETVSIKEQEFYPNGQLKKEELTQFNYTFFSNDQILLKSDKQFTSNEYYEDGSLKVEEKSGIIDNDGCKGSYSLHYNTNHFLEKYNEYDYEYLFDTENRPVWRKITRHLSDSIKEEQYFYEYTKKGQLKTVFYKKGNNEKELLHEYFYNSNDLLIEEHNLDHKTGAIYKYTEDDQGRLIKFESNSLRYIDNKFILASDYDSSIKWQFMDFSYDKNGNLKEITSSDSNYILWPYDKYLQLKSITRTFYNSMPETNDVISHYQLEKYFPIYTNQENPYKFGRPSVGKYEIDKDGRIISVPNNFKINYDSEGNISEIIRKTGYFHYYPVVNGTGMKSFSSFNDLKRKAEKNEFLLLENNIIYECKKDDTGRIIQKMNLNNFKNSYLSEYIYTPSGKLEKEIRKSMYGSDINKFLVKSVIIYNNKELPSKVLDSDGDILQMYTYKYNEDGSIKTKTVYTFEVPTSF